MRSWSVAVMLIVLSAAASRNAWAADLPSKAQTPAGVVSANWTGCYIGVNGGGGRAPNDWTLQGAPTDSRVHASGFIAGGQVGCDYQAGAWVFGVDGQFDWSDIDGQTTGQVGPAAFQLASKLDRFATATGRVGYAFDRVLTYAKGGFAWGHFNHELDQFVGTSALPFLAGDQDVAGFVVGAGFEVALLANWSFKAEYNYLDFGNNNVQLSCVVPGGGCPLVANDVKQNAQMVTFGLNYRFGPGIIATRY